VLVKDGEEHFLEKSFYLNIDPEQLKKKGTIKYE